MIKELVEKKVIGAMVAGYLKPSEIIIDPSDFADPELGECLRQARLIEKDGIDIDSNILASRVSQGQYGFYTSRDFELMAASVPSSSVALDAVAKVRSFALKTFILSRTAEIAQMEKMTAGQLVAKLRDVLTTAEKDLAAGETGFVFMDELKDRVDAVYQDLFDGVSYAVPTYFERIDREILDGFSKGDLHIVCGFTGQGKSALALNFALRQAKAGHCVGVVSREMSAIENVIRLQASDASVPRWKIKSQMFEQTLNELRANLETMAGLPMAFNTSTDNVEDLRPQIKQAVEERGMAIVYVDYLQLMHSSKNASRAEEVATVSRTLKLIAMENNIPVVALCQFNRGAVSASKFDLLSFLKESSGIEQDASSIVYVQFQKTDVPVKEKDGLVTILKNRNGAPFAEIQMTYQGETFTFKELSAFPGGHDDPEF